MKKAACALALSLVLCVPALAQTTADLTGTVTTPGGDPLANATVTAESRVLQGTRVTETNADGRYKLAALPPGDYTVRVALAGMTDAVSRVRLALSETSRLDFTLRPAFTEHLDVRGDAPSVLDTPEIATNLTLREVERLPIQRNQLAHVQLVAGVTANVLSNGQLQISGGPGYDNLVMVNGVVVNENTRGQMRPMYVEDAIQETTVLTGAISAEYGRFTGGVINTITRSGGNELSGSLRDSLTNPAWSAQSPAAEERENSLNHVWETTFGGFLLRDRLWFFTAGRWAKNDTARQTIPIPAFASPASVASPRISYTESNDQKRWEAKLTAQLNPQHNLVAALFGIDTHGENVRATQNFYDLASLSERDDPESLVSLHYNGFLAHTLLAEGRYARRKMSENNGSSITELIGGTVLQDRANQNARFNAPSFCAVCDTEQKNNQELLLKANLFLGTERFGTHDIVAGVDRFDEERFVDDHQSGSDFALFVSRAQWKDGVIYPVITPTNATGGGSFIRWMPILAPGTEDRLRSDALFVNDRWTLTSRWSFSAGARFDRNDAVNADGVVTSDDSRLSPRLAAHFDPRGLGRERFTASYAQYASRVAEGIASANQAAGSAAAIDFAYRGPAINQTQLTVPLQDVIRMVFDYFNTQQGGTGNRAAQNLRANGSRSVPGFTTYFDGSLATPVVREVSAGYGMQLGSRGFAKADYIHRDWRDLYATSVTTQTRRTNTPLGIPVDMELYRNTNNLERTYRALQLQGQWTATRVYSGVNYTWAELRGNDDGESANGAIPNFDPAIFYPEFLGYARFSPEGWLQGDQRHRLRAWVGGEIPLPPVIGRLELSVLHSFDSGLPYSMVGAINVTRYNGAPANPGYNSIPNGLYYFSDRGAFRTDDIHATSLAVRYSRNVFRDVQLFAQGDLVNAFNNDGIADPTRIGTTVTTAATSTTLQTFNPHSETPVEGIHYQRAANFGRPLNNLAYQTPRTYRVSVGFRF
jgi:Carboxypeptidase regulatory-like domain/TonB dependent receptor/TonB-dependent Receptor Plug Domain